MPLRFSSPMSHFIADYAIFYYASFHDFLSLAIARFDTYITFIDAIFAIFFDSFFISLPLPSIYADYG
jgi:hypothetical protein